MHDKGGCIKNLHPSRMVLHKFFYAPGGVDKKFQWFLFPPLWKYISNAKMSWGERGRGVYWLKKWVGKPEQAKMTKSFNGFLFLLLWKYICFKLQMWRCQGENEENGCIVKINLINQPKKWVYRETRPGQNGEAVSTHTCFQGQVYSRKSSEIYSDP